MTYRFPIINGDRVALAPHLDLWMAGVRFGLVIEQSVDEENERLYCVQYAPFASVWLSGEDLLGAVNAVPGKAESGASPSTAPLARRWDGKAEARANTVGSLPNEYGFICAEFEEFGSCIHSEHMMQAGL